MYQQKLIHYVRFPIVCYIKQCFFYGVSEILQQKTLNTLLKTHLRYDTR